MSPPRNARPPARPWSHWLGLAACGLVLLLLGQFQEVVFTWLAHGGQAVGALVGQRSAFSSPAAHGLSQHSLPASITYHLLYAGATVGALHVLLRGRGTPWIVGGLGAALAAGAGFLAWGSAAHWPSATQQGYLLMDLASSPLALLAGYALATLGQRPTG